MNTLNSITLACILALTSVGCSSAVLRKGPCDSVANRDDVQVCGKSEVLKRCRQAPEHDEFVCDKL